MKKITLILALLAASFSNAQISKGSKIIGTSFASFTVSGSKSETTYSNTPTVYNTDGNSFSFSINPYMGFFLADGLAVGGQVYVSFYSSKSDSSNTSTTTTSESKSTQPSFGVGPFVRYYFVKGQKMSPYAELAGGIDFNSGKSESSNSSGSSSETKTKPYTGWNVGPKIGFEYFISDYVGINVYTGFNYSASNVTYEYRPSTGTGYDYTNDYKRWYIPVGFGLQIHLPSGSSSK